MEDISVGLIGERERERKERNVKGIIHLFIRRIASIIEDT